MRELSSLGLNPDLLHELLEVQGGHSFNSSTKVDGSTVLQTSNVSTPTDVEGTSGPETDTTFPKVIYEFVEGSSKLMPRLRISLEPLGGLDDLLSKGTIEGQNRQGEMDESNFGDMIVDEELD